MPLLQRTTPQKTVPIKAFVVYLEDGRVIQVLVDGGEGFFREEIVAGTKLSFTTHQCFVAKGRAKLLTLFEPRGGEVSVQEPEVPEEEETDDDEESETEDE